MSEKKPSGQRYRPEIFQGMKGGYGLLFEKLNHLLNIEPTDVKTITEFGGGVGAATSSMLGIYPKAHIQVVDYLNILISEVAQDPRVELKQGLFVDLLERNALTPSMINVLGSMSDTHGFHEQNIELLKKYTAGNVLLTYGQSADLELMPWFRKSFDLVHENTDLWYAVWRSS